MKTLTSAQSKELEQSAVAAGISYFQLMENAGAAAALFMQENLHLGQQHRVAILCGKGNNGGDGFVMARYSSLLGASVDVVLTEGFPVTEPARAMFEKIQDTPICILNDMESAENVLAALKKADFVVDAIYGTGFHGRIKEPLLPLMKAVGESNAVVVSVDMPSGANCDTGAVEGECIKADFTVAFSTLKAGHVLAPARSFCGEVSVLPIGISAELIRKQAAALEVTECDFVKPILKPRDPESNKGTYGRLLCVCGSEGMAGAALMSAKAAARCGTGIVNAAVPRSIYGIVASHAAEPVFTLLDYDDKGNLSESSRAALKESLGKASACLIGCGLGRSKGAVEALELVLAQSRVPLIIDADGINILAENINRLSEVKVPVILTPHPGEMARLMRTTVPDVQSNRLAYAKQFAAEHRVILVLKGAGTLIAEPDGKTYLNPTGNAGMAKGGSGDVLAGMVSALAAQGIDLIQAAAGAVYLHGAAGDRCAQKLSQCAMLPTDIIDALPELFLQIEQKVKS